MRTVRTLAVGLAALALVATACGDDDDTTAATSAATSASTTTASTATTAPTESTASAESGGSDATADAAFCDAMLAFDTIESPDTSSATPEEVQAYVAQASASWADVVAAAPAEVQTQAQSVADSLDQAAADPSVLDDEAILDAFNPIETAAYDGCGFAQVSVTVLEYQYDGMPATVPAGPVAIQLDNQGAQFHIMLAIREPDGDTTPAVDFVDSAMASFESTGTPPDGVQVMGGDPVVAPPGAVGGKVTTLEPGHWVFFCPIPVEDDPSMSHYQMGMIAETDVV